MKCLNTIQMPAAVCIAGNLPNYDVDVVRAFPAASIREQSIRSSFEEAERELGRYASYSFNWDGYRATPFNSDVLQDAATVLHFSRERMLSEGIVPTLVTTGPASDGSVDVELEVGPRRILMTLYPNDEGLRLSKFDQDHTSEALTPHRAEALGQQLAWLSGS